MPIFTVGAAGTTSSGYEVANSLRFDSTQGTYLSLNQSTATSARKMTFSTWVKISKTDDYNILMENVASPHTSQIVIQNDGNGNDLRFYDYDGSTNLDFRTSMAFRDVSAWYHIVVAMDTTQSTASNRVKIYVNGSQLTAFDTETYPSQNSDTGISDGTLQIGRQGSSIYYIDGYLAETVFIDGQQLEPTNFGEFDSDTGIWKPIEIDVSSITFGNNGFYLDYENSGALGTDAAGSNNLTTYNITAVDQSLDTPTNNFCTINPLSVGPRNFGADSSGILTLGNTKCVFNGSGDDFGTTMAVSTGKWYWEAKLITAANHGSGFVDVDHFTDGDYDSSGGGIVNANGFVGSAESSTGSQYILNGTATSSAASYADNDIVGYAFDVDAGEMKIYQNGTLRDTITSIPTGVTYMPIIGDDSSTDASFEVNFGGSSGFTISSGNTDGKYGNFEYAPPSGYYALCTKRLAEFG